MADERVNRKLAAILAADVVGYSRLMGADEAGTLAALKRHRETVFDPAVAAHNGRIVKLIGDGTLVEFASVIDAVNCALSVQRSDATAPPRSASQPTIVLRIGINLGDVIIEGDDIYGDGVNVAARLGAARRAGRHLRRLDRQRERRQPHRRRFKDGGEVSVKNIERPIRIWKWHPGATGGRCRARKRLPATEAARPSRSPSCRSTTCRAIRSRSTSPTASREDIITDLSKVGGLLVIARNSSFAYKARSSISAPSVASLASGRCWKAHPPRRQPRPDHRPAHRCGNRRAPVGRALRPRPHRHLCGPGRGHAQIVDALKVALSPAEKARLADTGPPTSRRTTAFCAAAS